MGERGDATRAKKKSTINCSARISRSPWLAGIGIWNDLNSTSLYRRLPLPACIGAKRVINIPTIQ